METRKTKLALTASALAFALMLAGCGGGGSTSSAVTPSGGNGNNNPPPMEEEEGPPPAPTNVVELPAGHGIAADAFELDPEGFNKKDTFLDVNGDGEFTIMPGMSAKLGGVRFYCPDGDNACTLTLSFMDDGELDMVQYDEDGGMPTVAALMDRGWLAFKDLDPILIDGTEDEDPLDGDQLGELRANRYHEVTRRDGTPGTPGTPNNARDPRPTDIRWSGVTSSHTSHDDETCATCAERGVSDIRITVTPDTTEDPDSADREVLKVGEPPIDPNPGTDPWNIMDAVLADANGAITGNDGEASFDISAFWGQNTAARWEAEYTEDQGTRRPSLEQGQVWRYVFDAPMTGKVDLPGRTVDVDLRTDYDPNNMVLNTMNGGTGGPQNHPDQADAVPDNGTPNSSLTFPQGGAGTRIASGPTTSADTEVRIPWLNGDGERNITFDNEMQYPGFQREVNLAVDDPVTERTVEGADGSYMGVRGIFVCEDANDNGVCRINSHGDRNVMGSEMSVSEGDFVRFVPYEYAQDMDWLAAGVWLTIPDQLQADGYAIGAYVWGAHPWEMTAIQNTALNGTATYTGEAFGRFAEMVGDEMETGRFEATASLMADFRAAAEAAATEEAPQVFGGISGGVTDFVTYDIVNGARYAQSEPEWEVEFRNTGIIMRDNTAGNPQVPDANTPLVFNGGLSGHAHGSTLDGYWNGQFYNVREVVNAGVSSDIPGSVAGTFGATTERDTADEYALTLIGAFGAHEGGNPPDSNERFVWPR